MEFIFISPAREYTPPYPPAAQENPVFREKPPFVISGDDTTGKKK